MSKKDYRLFVDSDITDPLPPLYKGNKVLIYPGQLLKPVNPKNGRFGGQSSTLSLTTRSKTTGLRRYIFRYEGDNFVYLATRKGQRNGGFNSKVSQTKIRIIFTLVTGGQVEDIFSYTETNNSGEEIWTSSAYSYIQYSSLSTRWEWYTRPVPPTGQQPGPFFLNGYTQSTTNALKNTASLDQVQWTYVSDPWVTATPELPVSNTTIEAVVFYNNNSLDNLNKWPITNIDADYSVDGSARKWQTKPDGIIRPDRRIDGLSNDFLKKCFQGINLKHYDIVFVEVVWRYLAHRNSKRQIINKTNAVSWGYDSYRNRSDIHDIEWWSPKPYMGRRQKGRVYRVGILEANSGVGGVDKVLFAQRTRVITTDYRRGGETALE